MKYESLVKPPASEMMKAGRVVLKPGEDVGEHMTDSKEEVIIVLRGTATVLLEGKENLLNTGEVKYIMENTKHNVVNKTDKELEYVYVVALLEDTEVE